TYTVELRPKRDYKPYSVELLEFRQEYYPGTRKPKDYISDVHLSDPERNEERDARISMNVPLRHRGETLYQSEIMFVGSGTVLQVVRNPGVLLPYIACTMISLGMLVHFGIHL